MVRQDAFITRHMHESLRRSNYSQLEPAGLGYLSVSDRYDKQEELPFLHCALTKNSWQSFRIILEGSKQKDYLACRPYTNLQSHWL